MIGGEVIDENGKNLYVGPIMSVDRIYPAFLSSLEQETDLVMMPLMVIYLTVQDFLYLQ